MNKTEVIQPKSNSITLLEEQNKTGAENNLDLESINLFSDAMDDIHDMPKFVLSNNKPVANLK
jgi:hypothetical protein